MTRSRILICPFCAAVQPIAEGCRACGARLDPLGRRAEQNDMGPWWYQAEGREFAPGCSYETVVRLVEDGTIAKNTVLRGPTTRQLWTVARRVPGVAHLLGYCHACDAHVESSAARCPSCRAAFGAWLDRQHLNLSEIELLPGEAPIFEPIVRGTTPVVLEPTGISAFASDEELREGGAGRAESAPAPREPVEPSAEQMLSHPVVRALRGRVASETRLRWILLSCVVVSTALGALAVREAHRRGTIAGRADAAAERALLPPTPPPTDVDPTPSTVVAPPSEPVERTVEPDPPAAEPEAGAADERSTLLEETLQRVANLIAAARDATLVVDDRIGACDEALALLDTVHEPSPAHAALAAEQRREARALRERLELERFFDPPG